MNRCAAGQGPPRWQLRMCRVPPALGLIPEIGETSLKDFLQVLSENQVFASISLKSLSHKITRSVEALKGMRDETRRLFGSEKPLRRRSRVFPY